MAQLLQTLADPSLAYALFIVGCCALMAELFHPGSFVPGISGGICLLLAITGFLLLPVNWPSVVLIVAALGLFALDVHLTAHGGLTVVGLATFAAGSLTLYGLPNSRAPLALPLPLVLGLTLGGAALATFIVRAALHTRHMPSINGPQRLLGQTGKVTTALAPTGTVQVAGELWSARLNTPRSRRSLRGAPRVADSASQLRQHGVLEESPDITVAPGQPVRIVGRRGLILEVEPVGPAGGSAARPA